MKRPRPREDPISLEDIRPEHMFTINRQTYNVRSLARALLEDREARIPHSRRTPSQAQLAKISSRLPEGVLKNWFRDSFVPKKDEKVYRPLQIDPTVGRHILIRLHWVLAEGLHDAYVEESDRMFHYIRPEELRARVGKVRAGDTLMLHQYSGGKGFATIREPTVEGVLRAVEKAARAPGLRSRGGLQIHGASLRRSYAAYYGLDPTAYPRLWRMDVR